MRKKQKKSKIITKIVFVIIMIFIELVVFSGGYLVGVNTSSKRVINTDNTTLLEQSVDNRTEEDIVEEIISKMSLEEMVYQMMFVTPESITNVSTVVQAGESTKKALEKYPVGGIIYFSNNFKSREQTINMISNTQNYSKIPLFISVDEEGGRVARLGSNPSMKTTKMPTMLEVGNTGDAKRAYEVGKTLAIDLKKLGFNVDFAPDADVLINKNNTEIGDRSFGSDPNLVSEMVENVVKGLQDNGISATIKHFPGHGSTIVDSHTGYSASNRTIEELRENEFLPFKAGIAAGVNFVLVSGITMVNISKEKVPSSVCKQIVTDLLINELGYNGIIITDSFRMGAISDAYSVGEAAVKAVNAGVDMVLMSPDVKVAHDAIVKSVENGEISKERIEYSVKKILLLKVKKGMIK